MKQVSITELKNKLSQYLRLVKKGETIEILEHSIPIARIEAARTDNASPGRLDRLVRDGIITRARRKPDRKLLDKAPVACLGDAVQALVDERGR